MGPGYDPYPPYGRGPRRLGRGRRRPVVTGGGGACWRDACLLETGCCVGEAISDNCLIATVLLLPRFLGALNSGGRGGADRMVAAIRVYQREISAYRPPVCRFEPSCSRYAVEALQTHGAWRGSWLALQRLARCRPGGRRGADPVPARILGGLTVG